jgi:hypothetical protein
MFSTFFTVALFVAAGIHGVSAAFAVNSPELKQCQPAKISWAPTQGPYNVVVTKASDPCGEPLVDLGDFKTTVTQWTVNLPSGTEVQVSVLDAKDQEAWSSKITIGAGDSSCLPPTSPPPKSSSAPAASPTPDSPGPVSPLGAANAGVLGSSAITARQASVPILALAGLVTIFALL